MATFTSFPSRPIGVENTEDSVSDPYGASMLHPTHHTISSGIDKYILQGCNFLSNQPAGGGEETMHISV